MRSLPLAVAVAFFLLACSGGAQEGDGLVTEPAPTVAAPTDAAPTDAPTAAETPTLPGAPTGEVSLDAVETYNNLSQDHVDGPVDYEQNPPVGGPHAGEWLNCGFYVEPVTKENAVHSMEHGAVWITYGETVDPAGLQQLAAQDHVLVTPYEDLPAPVVASAWGIQLLLEDPDDPRLALFVETFAAGPQTPEPGAPCDGGIGTPEPAPASV